MLNKKLNWAFAFMLGGFFLASIAFTGCGNNGESKEEKKDSTETKMETPKSAMADTAKAKDTVKFTPPVIVKDSPAISKRPIHTPN